VLGKVVEEHNHRLVTGKIVKRRNYKLCYTMTKLSLQAAGQGQAPELPP
jgi:hypothetical protein